MNKAKVNDMIRAFNYSNIPERGYFVGMVTKIESDEDGVEYVYYTAIGESRNGENKNVFKPMMRIAQNGQETMFGDVTNFIEVL